ncbi:hypothetical protein EDD22DRAFT_849870 [Suillus occidentalis]|nr:hypothetical protein EDD22DRAFT_849870 [Suillus occidentalis]
MTININDVSLLLKCLSIFISGLVVDMGNDPKSHSTVTYICLRWAVCDGDRWAGICSTMEMSGPIINRVQWRQSRFERDMSITKRALNPCPVFPLLKISDPEQTMPSRISNDKGDQIRDALLLGNSVGGCDE